MNGPEAVVMVLDRALGESVKRGAAPGRVIVLLILLGTVELGTDDAEVFVVLVVLAVGRRAVELSSSGGDGMCLH